MRHLVADPEQIEELLESDDDLTTVDLDKAWHGVHWLLTGSAEPTTATASLAILGGEPFGEDLGYGPARILSPESSRDVGQLLASLDFAALRDRVDPDAMDAAGVYPAIWTESDIFDSYLLPALHNLRDFYGAASSSGEYVIQTLC